MEDEISNCGERLNVMSQAAQKIVLTLEEIMGRFKEELVWKERVRLHLQYERTMELLYVVQEQFTPQTIKYYEKVGRGLRKSSGNKYRGI